jgi:hypothetical protein
VQPAHVLEEVTPRRRRERRCGEHERHVLASVRELLQRPQGVLGNAERLDPIFVGVPLDKLRLDVVESVPIVVDGEQDRHAHPASTLTQWRGTAKAPDGDSGC